ncbi:MAG: isoprenylcysteine carboxylmethyltransferase family protein [Acidobacteria bacterium]|nr:isoprenylcysteine carboxylmethyltransferase family protein [Acidobacteriota bacterium]
MTTKTQGKTGWQRVARRIRVPLGFVVAAVFLVFARSSWHSMAWSLLLVLPGIWLRGYAAGYVKKNAELTRTGPYAYTRNPLYLGSMGIAFGFAVAAGRAWLGLLLLVMFLAIYVPTILSEEAYLRGVFPEFEAYAQRVPRLLPRLTAAGFEGSSVGGGRFSSERYLHHREYNALMGAAAIYVALVLRMLLKR